MRRRDVIAGFAGAAAWPLLGHTQQSLPVRRVGVLTSFDENDTFAKSLFTAFREGLGQIGYIEGRNLAIEYRWADGQYDRLPSLAADLANRRVDVIAASGGDLAALAAKSATSTIPIVFATGDDPVATGLVASLSRPSANLTGVSMFLVELHAKRLELVTELVPQIRAVALLVNPKSPQTERVVQATQIAARAKGLQLHVIKAADENEIAAAFASLSALKVGALVQQADPFFTQRRDQFALLAARYAIPAIYETREFAEAGGLMSYGISIPEMYQQLGIYCGRILNGEKPSELPVVQPTKFDLVVNLKAAKVIGLTIPESFLLRADQVIE